MWIQLADELGLARILWQGELWSRCVLGAGLNRLSLTSKEKASVEVGGSARMIAGTGEEASRGKGCRRGERRHAKEGLKLQCIYGISLVTRPGLHWQPSRMRVAPLQRHPGRRLCPSRNAAFAPPPGSSPFLHHTND